MLKILVMMVDFCSLRRFKLRLRRRRGAFRRSMIITCKLTKTMTLIITPTSSSAGAVGI